jgi:hypothetical protein
METAITNKLIDIDFKLIALEDVLHGSESDTITEARGLLNDLSKLLKESASQQEQGYTRDEVIRLCTDAYLVGMERRTDKDEFNEWIADSIPPSQQTTKEK